MREEGEEGRVDSQSGEDTDIQTRVEDGDGVEGVVVGEGQREEEEEEVEVEVEEEEVPEVKPAAKVYASARNKKIPKWAMASELEEEEYL